MYSKVYFEEAVPSSEPEKKPELTESERFCSAVLLPPAIVAFLFFCLVILLSVISDIFGKSYIYAPGPIAPIDMIGTWKIENPGNDSSAMPNWEATRIFVHEDGTCDCKNMPQELIPKPLVSEKNFTANWTIEKSSDGISYSNQETVYPYRIRFSFDGEYFFSIRIANEKPPYQWVNTLGDPDECDYFVWCKTE